MIRAYVAAAAAIALFLVLLKSLGVVVQAHRATTVARESMGVLTDATLSDDEKERAAQGASARLFGHFLQITLRSLAALAAPTIVLYAADRFGLVSFNQAIEAMVSWPIIGATLAAALAGAVLFKPRAP